MVGRICGMERSFIGLERKSEWVTKELCDCPTDLRRVSTTTMTTTETKTSGTSSTSSALSLHRTFTASTTTADPTHTDRQTYMYVRAINHTLRVCLLLLWVTADTLRVTGADLKKETLVNVTIDYCSRWLVLNQQLLRSDVTTGRDYYEYSQKRKRRCHYPLQPRLHANPNSRFKVAVSEYRMIFAARKLSC